MLKTELICQIKFTDSEAFVNTSSVNEALVFSIVLFINLSPFLAYKTFILGLVNSVIKNTTHLILTKDHIGNLLLPHTEISTSEILSLWLTLEVERLRGIRRQFKSNCRNHF